MSRLEISNSIRHHRNNINAWELRQRLYGEDWAEMIAYANAEIGRLEGIRPSF